MFTKPIQDLIIFDKVFFTISFWRVSNILGQGIIVIKEGDVLVVGCYCVWSYYHRSKNKVITQV